MLLSECSRTSMHPFSLSGGLSQAPTSSRGGRGCPGGGPGGVPTVALDGTNSRSGSGSGSGCGSGCGCGCASECRTVVVNLSVGIISVGLSCSRCCKLSCCAAAATSRGLRAPAVAATERIVRCLAEDTARSSSDGADAGTRVAPHRKAGCRCCPALCPRDSALLVRRLVVLIAPRLV